jgi:hypothetical protein
MESRFAYDFSQVRVHTDDQAAEAAHGVGVLAFTTGPNIVFGREQYQPDSVNGRHLLAHELMHVMQQGISSQADRPLSISNPYSAAERQADAASVASSLACGSQFTPIPVSSRVVQLTPAPPTFDGTTGVFDRGKVVIGPVPELIATVSSSDVTLAPTSVTVTVAISNPDVTHLTWELYDPNDQLIDGFSTLPTAAQATSRPYPLAGPSFHGGASEGRYTLRCIGQNKGHPLSYADRTFFVWTRPPLIMQGLPDLQAITSAPATHSLGEVGAAAGRSMMLEHQAAVATTGTGKYQGSQLPSPPAGVSKQDCTTYVLTVLEKAFSAKGRKADWDAVFKEAQTTSGAKFKGTELMRALESKAGWKGVFWSPDPRNPEDRRSEHPVAFKGVQNKGTYYGVDVLKDKSVVDYKPTSATKQESMGNLDRLRRIPLGVIAARGGTHMTLVLNGHVYEVHWDLPATDPNVIQETPLEQWAWQSGAVVMPPEDFNASFGP